MDMPCIKNDLTYEASAMCHEAASRSLEAMDLVDSFAYVEQQLKGIYRRAGTR